jgi:hypothetical protein
MGHQTDLAIKAPKRPMMATSDKQGNNGNKKQSYFTLVGLLLQDSQVPSFKNPHSFVHLLQNPFNWGNSSF